MQPPPKAEQRQQPQKPQSSQLAPAANNTGGDVDISLFGGSSGSIGFFTSVPDLGGSLDYYSNQILEEQQRVMEIERTRQASRQEERNQLIGHHQSTVNEEDPYGMCDSLSQLVLYEHVDGTSAPLALLLSLASVSSTAGFESRVV